QLAAADPDDLPAEIGLPSRKRLQRQAYLQMAERRTGTPQYELLDPEPGLGLLRLPEPDPGDVYLDFEGDPWANGGEGREYLAGLWDRGGRFTTWWAHDDDEEKALTRDLLVDLNRRLDAHPGMHVYHYAPYERSALARLTQRHGVAEAEFDRLLRGGVLVDLYAVVRQGLRISKESYSIKKMEAFYWGHIRQVHSTDDGVADALSSVVQYEKWLLDRDDQAILDAIAAYNRDDVRSTHDLHAWLEERRAELCRERGEQFERPAPPQPVSLDLSDAERAEVELADELLAQGEDLLAGLVGWHRRELRPQWWDYFRVEGLTDEELVRDSTALGELGPAERRGTVKRSTIWRFSFPPQDCKLGDKVANVDTHKPVWTVEEIDPVAGWIDLRIGNTQGEPSARGLGVDSPLLRTTHQASLQRTARDVLAGIRSPLLDRVVPNGLDRRPGESAADVVLRAGRDLRGRVLAVQGPPGSGKTHTGADLVRQLLGAGLRVGVTAQSHAVIGHLLRKIDRPALQKCTEEQHCGSDDVEATTDNATALAALRSGRHRLVGGTSWLWAREDMENSVDVLVIDEAGQFSLADAVAVSRAASGLVLLGDPQQLASPTQAQHPYGAEVSALEHMLEGATTMPAHRGVFLDTTRRMHPAITAVVSSLMYEGRLTSLPGLERQALYADGLPEAGVVWTPVAHTGHASASTEEAQVVAELLTRVRAGSWRDAKGVERPMTLDDVLVVAPYNAHVARLKATLPTGARIGTVDKFQGQEAPVVVYSMASSSAADAPRGVSFLYDLHRLNVAIS
ncbi:MAG TPA: TM0106 family RecB-like putative nuclease, partial [Mycobacteriales bacterium]